MVNASKVQDIRIDKITISPLHFTRTHTEDNLERLADSIQDVGLIHPITVRKRGKVFELLAGERRWKACKMLGMREIRAIVRVCDDYTAELLSIKENTEGTEPMTLTEEKRAVDRAVELAKERIVARPDIPDPDRSSKKGKTSEEQPKKVTEQEAREEAAGKLGMSISKVSRIRNLDKLVPAAMRAYERQQITKNQAAALAGMSKSEQRDELPKMIREGQRETTNRSALEKGGKDADYKGTMKQINILTGHCEAVSSVTKALMEEMSPEAAADIEEESRNLMEKARDDLEQLLAHIGEVAGWAKSQVSDE